MISPKPSALRPRLVNGALMLVILAAVAVVYWPGVHGFWGRDDYFQLAFVRLLDTPWSLFVHDHFPVPGSVFRPLGVASMWLGAMLFGTDYPAHAAADLVLHAGVGVALFGLLLCARIPRALALVCSLFFALHPVVIGTALWWSARFDVLATLFILFAVLFAIDYRDRRRTLALGGCCVALLAAMLSKEIGFAALLPVSLLWLRWAWSEPAHRSKALRALAWAWFCAAIYFGWRWCVLGTPASGLTGTTPVTSMIATGLLDWATQVAGYVAFWSRLDPLQQSALVLALISMPVMAGIAMWRRRVLWGGNGDLAWCGLGLFLLPALLQAPVAALNSAPLSESVSAIEAAMQSRLYYLGIAGLAITLAALLAPVWADSTSRWRAGLIAPLVLAIIVFAGASRNAADTFATRSVAISAVARAAVAAVAEVELPAAHCQVAFLDVDPAPEWSIYVSMDSVIKALSPDLDWVKECYFHSDYVTYFYLVGAPIASSHVGPYQPLRVDGAIVAPRRIGDAVIDYLSPPKLDDVHDVGSMRFLRYRDGRFQDVTARVDAGSVRADLR